MEYIKVLWLDKISEEKIYKGIKELWHHQILPH